ncbi:hypothetical protein SAMN05216421_2890 [Halopseudomonas xinjiangensis]|uniref:Uncharacterized protein n=2 Tax=Halopseudomonas xinjiangensis TaxID=487184 RepID=A0A1H1XKB2_9GAMM|nr:hypothetical protein SAMN05216421_2890 [Halopseudomonas xinjiangensis]
MSEFQIESSDTEATLLFSGIRGDYFTVALSSGPVNARRDVWAYTDAHGLADLFEWMALQSKPWSGTEGWESLEGEFNIYASCCALGAVTFDIEMSHLGIVEEWRVTSRIKSEFGQLPSLATKARSFFGPSPS